MTDAYVIPSAKERRLCELSLIAGESGKAQDRRTRLVTDGNRLYQGLLDKYNVSTPEALVRRVSRREHDDLVQMHSDLIYADAYAKAALDAWLDVEAEHEELMVELGIKHHGGEVSNTEIQV